MPDKDKNTPSGLPSTDRITGKSGGTVAGPDTGAALRSIYQTTVEEQIPADLMDLLGKLT